MTRFKKFIRSKGYKLNVDYPYLPYDVRDTNTTLENVTTFVIPEIKAIVIDYDYNVAIERIYLFNDMTEIRRILW